MIQNGFIKLNETILSISTFFLPTYRIQKIKDEKMFVAREPK